MPPSSQQPSEGARRLSQTILRRLASVKNQDVGNAIGRDESTISRIASNELGLKLNDLHGFLDVLGLKCVDKTQVCVDRDVYESYRVLARTAINDPKKLNWDDAE